MSRNMSFFLTTEQYLNGSKTVTRRLGWKFAKVGDICNGVEKCQGLKKGEKVVRLGQHKWVSLRWERLDKMITNPSYGAREVIKEGFPSLLPQEFVMMFCDHHKIMPETPVHRMEFVKLSVRNNEALVNKLRATADILEKEPEGADVHRSAITQLDIDLRSWLFE